MLHRLARACLALAFVAGVTLSLPGAVAQTTEAEETDKGFLTNFLEEVLTDAGREVRITNFQGALSSRATIDRLTIADDQGIWLIARDLVLNWDRAALFSGVLDITELSAAEIEMPRLPATDDSLPPPEAGEFRVPELPVEIRIDRLDAPRIALGRPVLGQAAVLRLAGSARLAEGGGRVTLETARIDDRQGRLRLRGAYDPAANTLMVDMGLLEAPGGIAATALNIPGRPSVALTLAGSGPVEDFNARLRLATDGIERVSGTAGLTSDDSGNRVGRVEIEGDLTPLMPERERAFFAGSSRLRAVGRRNAAGALSLDTFTLRTQFADLTGSARLSPGGALRALSVTGALADAAGAPVPLPGGAATIRRADVSIRFDADAGDDWQALTILQEVTAQGLSMGRARLDGGGVLIPAGRDDAGLRGEVSLDLSEVAFADAGLARLFGDRLTGQVDFDKSPGRSFAFRALDLAAGADGTRVTGSGIVDGFASGFRSVLNLRLDAPDLARLGTISGLDGLRGQGSLALSGEVTPLSGAFDLSMDARTDPLVLGQPEADALLNRPTVLGIQVNRGIQGIRLERLVLDNSALDLTATGLLSSDESWFDYEARLGDLSEITVAGVTGRGVAELAGTLRLRGAGGSALGSVTARGRIMPDLVGGQAVLPVAGRAMRLSDADLDAQYFVQEGKARLQLNAREVALPWAGGVETEARATALDLSFDGTRRGAVWTGDARVTGRGVTLPDTRFGPLVGAEPDIRTRIVMSPDGNLELTGIEARLAAAQVTGDAGWRRTPDGKDRIAGFAGRVSVGDLARLSGLTGVRLSGSGEAAVTAEFTPASGALSVGVQGQARRLGVGMPLLNRVLAGALDYQLQITRRDETAPLALDHATLQGPRFSARAAGDTFTGFSVGARLADLALVAPDFSGPVVVDGTITPRARGALDRFGVDVTMTGPGGTSARLTGRYAPRDPPSTDLALRGELPLGLLNPTLAPRRLSGRAELDLSLRGAPQLENVSGRIAASGARLSAPTLSIALTDLSLGATLSSGRAEVAGAARGADGGRIDLSGTIGLADLSADLRAGFQDLRYRRGEILETRVRGDIDVSGPLLGGARISGTVTLGQTEIRVAPTGASALESIPDINFIASSRPARETRRRAGIGETPGRSGNGGASSIAAYPLDITINAPSQVFVRGRGMDAELGGRIRIGGTTRNPVPQGRFDLIRGRIDILTQRFELDEGSAQVLGNLDPYLRLVASTEKEGVTVSVVVEGAASAPDVSFVSVPELPEEEVIALLIFGRRLDRLSPVQALELASAIATLAGRGGIGVIEKLRRGFSLDDLDLTTTDSGETAVRAGKYLSDNVYSDVTVDTKGEVELNLNLDLGPNVKARGGVSSNGNTGIGLFFEKDY